MHDARGVGHRQGARQLPSEAGQRAGVEGFADQRGQRSSFHELHGEEAAIAQIADGVDRDDVGVIERRRGPRLVLEAPHRVGVAGERGPEQLDRDLAAKLGIVGQVDLTHAAAADERHHVVGADASAQRRGVLLSRQPLGGHVHRRRGDEVTRALACAASNDSTSHRRSSSAPQASPRNAGRSFGRQRQRRMEQLADPLVLLGVIDADPARGRARPGPGSSPAGRCRPIRPARAPFRPGSARRRSAARRRGTAARSGLPVCSRRRRARSGRRPASSPRHPRLPTARRGARPPPRFARSRVRAMSTSTRRIICAAAAKKWARLCQRTSCQSTSRRYASLTSAVGCRRCPGRSPAMKRVARRCSSSCTSGVNASRAAWSPWLHETSSCVMFGGALMGGCRRVSAQQTGPTSPGWHFGPQVAPSYIEEDVILPRGERHASNPVDCRHRAHAGPARADRARAAGLGLDRGHRDRVEPDTPGHAPDPAQPADPPLLRDDPHRDVRRRQHHRARVRAVSGPPPVLGRRISRGRGGAGRSRRHRRLNPAAAATYDAALARQLGKQPSGHVRRGAELGARVAAEILAWRQSDGWVVSPFPAYSEPMLPGRWQPTPPNFPTATFTHLQFARPMALLTCDAVPATAAAAY